MRLVPWLPVLLVGSTIVFLIRLRKQWQPGKAVARSVVESARIPGSSRASRLTRWRPMMLIGILVLFAGILLFSGTNILMSQEWSEEWSGSDRLRGWSSLDWTVAYDGYGEVGLENRCASLRPMPSERPIESHAALALAGGSSWRGLHVRNTDESPGTTPPKLSAERMGDRLAPVSVYG